MNAELRSITIEDIKLFFPDPEVIEASRMCDPLFLAHLGPVLLGFVGFIPRSTLSDTAYVWVHVTPEASQYKLAIIRLARRWVPTFHSRYPNLIGHCFTAPARNWLRTLEARFWPENVFTIEAHDG